MKVDYLIVGQGIAGSVMALTLEQRGKTVAILSKPELSSSSRIAAGVYNPFNFRRSVPTWKAMEACAVAEQFYVNAEEITGEKFHQKKTIFRIFQSEQERVEWKEYLKKTDRQFAEKVYDHGIFGFMETPLGYGMLNGGGVIRTEQFLEAVAEYFNNRGYYLTETCEHSRFSPNENEIVYDDRVHAKHVIFCEGHLAKSNPFFADGIIAPTHGEILHVDIPKLEESSVVNSAVYLVPLKGDRYICGATFNPGRADEKTTDAGREELLGKLKQNIDLDIRVADHLAGVRPAGKDRKPVIGRSRHNRNFSIFNGFGSKAVLMSPLLAQMLADHLENGAEILPEVNISRFKVY